MIAQILELLKTDDFFNVSEIVDIAKGKPPDTHIDNLTHLKPGLFNNCKCIGWHLKPSAFPPVIHFTSLYHGSNTSYKGWLMKKCDGFQIRTS